MSFLLTRSPFGPIGLEAENGAIVRLLLPAARPEAVPSSASSGGSSGEAALLRAASARLDEYWQGRRTVFDLPLRPAGTGFMLAVWRALCAVPYGRTAGYGDIARAVGRPKACRAVGLANNRNPIPIFIPCHRIIGADGALVGYGGGLEMKENLLRLEGAPFGRLSARNPAGQRCRSDAPARPHE